MRAVGRVFELTSIELRPNIVENLLCLFFYLKWLNTRHFEYSRQAMFTERLKTNGTAIKIAKETTNNQ